jgi:hypothetical protein
MHEVTGAQSAKTGKAISSKRILIPRTEANINIQRRRIATAKGITIKHTLQLQILPF